MSFIVTSPPPSPVESSIENAPFWPAIDPTHCRGRMRIDGNTTPERLRAALVEAMGAANAELGAWAADQVAAGYATLGAVPAPSIDGTSLQVHRYHHAVCALAAASLIERYRSTDATNDGHQYADRLELSTDDLRRDARWALADIRGAGRSTVELI